MANILQFVHELLTTEAAQQRFETDRRGHLKEHGFGDLSGEDVVEAVRSVRGELPPALGERLAGYADEGGATPPARPLVGETELDAAIRQLVHVLSLVTGRPLRSEPSGAGRGSRPAPAAAATTTAPADETTETAHDGGDVQPPTDDADAIRGELTAVVDEAVARVSDALRRADELAASTIQFAEAEAASIRAAAASEADELRQMASEEADDLLASAKAARDEANERLATAKAADDEAQARRAEILATEERLRAKLEEVESVVHSLRDRPTS
jgi:hypothetical protein